MAKKYRSEASVINQRRANKLAREAKAVNARLNGQTRRQEIRSEEGIINRYNAQVARRERQFSSMNSTNSTDDRHSATM